MCCPSSSESPFKKPINKLYLQRQEWFIYQWPGLHCECQTSFLAWAGSAHMQSGSYRVFFCDYFIFQALKNKQRCSCKSKAQWLKCGVFPKVSWLMSTLICLILSCVLIVWGPLDEMKQIDWISSLWLHPPVCFFCWSGKQITSSRAVDFPSAKLPEKKSSIT